MTYEEFIARAQEARQRPTFSKELRQLYVDNGTLQVLVKDILELRQGMLEALTNMHMINQEMIYKGIGQQGQVMAVDQILRHIHEAITRTQDDDQEVSVEQRSPVP